MTRPDIMANGLLGLITTAIGILGAFVVFRRTLRHDRTLAIEGSTAATRVESARLLAGTTASALDGIDRAIALAPSDESDALILVVCSSLDASSGPITTGLGSIQLRQQTLRLERMWKAVMAHVAAGDLLVDLKDDASVKFFRSNLATYLGQLHWDLRQVEQQLLRWPGFGDPPIRPLLWPYDTPTLSETIRHQLRNFDGELSSTELNSYVEQRLKVTWPLTRSTPARDQDSAGRGTGDRTPTEDEPVADSGQGL